MRKRYLALLVGAGLIGGYVLGHVHTTSEGDPEITPGTVFSGIAEDYVLMLSFTSELMTVTAQRSKIGGEFAVQATFADDRPTQRCTARPDLSGELGTFSSYVAKRQISFEERGKEFPVHVGNLIVQPWGQEPGGPMMVFTNKDRTSVAFVFDRYAAELTIPLAAFNKLEAGCAGLVRK